MKQTLRDLKSLRVCFTYGSTRAFVPNKKVHAQL